jgi:heterotetrameric sarcosine oxidase delta subunit
MVAPARIARHPMCADDIVSVNPLCPRASGLGASQPMLRFFCTFGPICLVWRKERSVDRPTSGSAMSFLLTCPNCGPREVTDFVFGGEVVPRPSSKPSQRELNTYNYFRRNLAGVQREWWYHRSGCRAWFVADRDTTTNQVSWVGFPE